MADEYIRKQDVKDALQEKVFHNLTDEFYGAMQVLDELPPVDVAPVRHGKWTHKPDVYGVVYCSECNYELHANSTSFCPNCGAKMDGGDEHG